MELTVDKAQSLKQFTDDHYAQGSFYFDRLLRAKEIKVNGKRVGKDIPVYCGDVVTYYLTRKQQEKAAFHTVYEDENVLIVDKEDGVNSEAVYAALSREGAYAFIHRLDRNTKGVLAFAKTPAAERSLLAAFRQHTVQKSYHALCFGAPTPAERIMTDYLKKNEEKSEVKIYSKPVSGSEKIVTEYKTLSSDGELSLVEIRLHTGKTHQIRAHFAHIGCPIVGDMKYGDTARNKTRGVSRQILVAKRLQFHFDGELSYLNGTEFLSRFDAELPRHN